MRKIAFWFSLLVILTFPTEDYLRLPGWGSWSKAIGLAAAAFWFATVLVTRKFRRPHPLHLIAFLFLIWNAVSLIWSLDVGRTTRQLGTYLQLIGMFCLLWDLYTTPAALKAGLQAYVLGCLITTSSLFYNFITGSLESAGRFSATGVNPNEIGLILALGLPMAWYLAIDSKSGKKLRLLNYAFIPIAYFAILLTASRGSLMASLPASLFILSTASYLKTHHRVLIFGALLAAFPWLLQQVPADTMQRLSSTGSEIEGADLNGRVAIWKQGIEVFKERPLIGVGSNVYKRAVPMARPAHNTFLSLLVEVGLVGFALFICMFALAVYSAFQQPKLEFLFWGTLITIWFVGAMVHNWEHTKHTWLVMSLAIVGANFSPEPRSGFLRNKEKIYL